MRYIDIHIKLILLSFIILLSVESIYADSYSRIDGQIRDSNTNEPLPYANVVLVGTSLGAASDINGNYMILNVPQGTYVLRSTFIGYETEDVSIVVSSGERISQDFELIYGAIVQGKALIVTAQAKGQMEAINRQLSAQSIMNIVSSAKIQELPDANAAESLGRLPGVSITRVGGEGSKVVIRGIAPKHNVIMVDGVRMASANPNERSTELSMISSNMLESIEVSKTVTADQDGDVLGGTVNFRLREAQAGEKKGLGVHLLYQRGYTGLSNAINKYDNYKFVPSIEGRFLNNRLGVLIQANLEKRNLSSNNLGAVYTNHSNDLINYVTTSVNLRNVYRDRQRENATLVLDYRLPEGKIRFSNFATRRINEVVDRKEIFDINRNSHHYHMSFWKGTSNMITNSFSIEKQIAQILHADLKLSHSYSEHKNPNNWELEFFEQPAGISQFKNIINIDPVLVTEAAFIDPTRTNLNTALWEDRLAIERSYMASLDFKVPMNRGKLLTSEIKFGGKFQSKEKSYEVEHFSTTGSFISPSSRGAANMIIEHLGQPMSPFSAAIPLSWFIDSTFTYGEFLDGDYSMHNPIQFEMAEDVIEFLMDNIEAVSVGDETFYRDNYLSKTNNYSGGEKLTAAYMMATINVGPKFTFIPGVRYQNLKTAYLGIRGQEATFSYYNYDHTDTTITINHSYWLPSMNLQYKPNAWFDVRLSYSNTISYPDYNRIIPRIHATTGSTIYWNNYKLKPARSKNYDAYFTVHENKIGLFTAGIFLKQIDNLIYSWNFSKAGFEARPYYLPYRDPSPTRNYKIITHINNPFVVNDWGLELDWQTHFWYLPGPLNGLVLNVNYTHVKSEAEYPFVLSGATSVADIDTSFTDRLIYQPNHILNISIGYDYKDFSIRMSMLYQDDVFSGVSQWPQLRSNTAAYKRWDLVAKQKFPFGLQLYGNLSNINGSKDSNVLAMYPDIPKSMEAYGMAAELGLRWQF